MQPKFYLQHLLFPRPDIYQPRNAYFHTDGFHVPGEHQVELHMEQWLVTDSYFNVFDLDFWNAHTTVRTLGFELNFSGLLLCRVYYSNDPGDHKQNLIMERLLSSGDAEHGTELFSGLRCANLRGMLTLEFISRARRTVVRGGGFFTGDEPSVPSVKIGMVVCTYKREHYLLRNIAQWRRDLFLDPDWQERFELFLADNGGTVALADETPGVHLLRNRNSGGAGGFTRGMMAAEKSDCTHMLLMDDDIVIHSGILKRAWQQLRYLKPKVCLSAAMINIDENMNIQHERGGYLVADAPGTLLNLAMGHRLNIEHFSSSFHQKVKCFNYGAWWWFLCPLTALREDKIGFAFPFFVKGDDIDFSLRLADAGYRIVFPGGFAVWHEPFFNKLSPINEYLATRNQLIQASVHDISYAPSRDWLKFIFKFIFSCRYDSAEMMIRGLEDFCRGPESLVTRPPDYMIQDGKKLIRHETFHPLTGKVITEKRFNRYDENILHRWFRLFTMNGLFFPALHDEIAVFLNEDKEPWARESYRCARITYVRPSAGEYYTVCRDRRRALALLTRAMAVTARLSHCRARAARAWKRAYPELISAGFWENYLGLNGQTKKGE